MRIGVLQPLPGIGDMVWYAPALRALAANAPQGKITLLTRSSVQAGALFQGLDIVENVIDLPRKKRGIAAVLPNFFRTWQALRQARVDRLYILHHSCRYRWAARLAGIRDIIAYPSDIARADSDGWVKSLSFLRRLQISIPEENSRLAVDAATLAAIGGIYKECPHPWIVAAPGASVEQRRWPSDRFASLVDGLLQAKGGTVFLLGSAGEAARVNEVYAQSKNKESIKLFVGKPFDQAMALMDQSLCLVGNDSGPANVAAALGRASFPLCGTSEPPLHSPHLHLIKPDRPSGEGMAAISVAHALQTVLDALA